MYSVSCTHQACKCSELCTAVTRQLVQNCAAGALGTNVQCTPHAPRGPKMNFCAENFLQLAIFAYRNALLAPSIACVAHCCAEYLRFAESFRHSKYSKPAHRTNSDKKLTDGDHRCSFLPMYKWYACVLSNDSLALNVNGTLYDYPTCLGWRLAPPAPVRASTSVNSSKKNSSVPAGA